MEEIKIRKDLNEIVERIGFATIKSSYGTRHPLRVVLKDGSVTGKVLDIRDKDGVYDAIQSYQLLGEKDFVKRKELVEELSIDEEGNASGSYICVKYELADGNIFRFFFERPQQIIIENLYKLYKRTLKSPAKQG